MSSLTDLLTHPDTEQDSVVSPALEIVAAAFSATGGGAESAWSTVRLCEEAGGGRKAASGTQGGNSFGKRNSQKQADPSTSRDQSGWMDWRKMTVSMVPQTKSLREQEGLHMENVSLPTPPR